MDGYTVKFKEHRYLALPDPETIGELIIPHGHIQEYLLDEFEWIEVSVGDGKIYYTKEAYEKEELNVKIYKELIWKKI